jgi:hypothetical protein
VYCRFLLAFAMQLEKTIFIPSLLYCKLLSIFIHINNFEINGIRVTEIDNSEKDKLEGKYANYYRVGYNAFEFIIEFSQVYQGEDGNYFHTRIISAPIYAKELLALLNESIKAYESSYGPILDE